MDFSKELVSDEKKEKVEETKDIVDSETGEILTKGKIEESYETALTFPRAFGFQNMELKDQAYVYAVHKAAEKILKDRIKFMNEGIKERMTKENVLKAVWSDVKISHDVPAAPTPVESLDMELLAEALGTDETGLADAGLAERTVTYRLKDKDEIKAMLDDPSSFDARILYPQCELSEAVGKATVKTTPAARADRIIITPQGELKAVLAEIKRKALPQKKRDEK